MFKLGVMFRHATAIMATIYVAVLSVLAFLSRILAHPPTWVALPNIFTPLWFLPLVLLFPLSFVVRSVLLRVATASLLLLFVVLFGSWFVPRKTLQEGAKIRFITFNHLFSNEDTERILASLRQHDADIIALQELSPLVASALSTLEDAFPYQALEPHDSSSNPFPSGLGLLSRHPFERDTYEFDPELHFQRVAVRVDGQSLTLFNVHLPAPLRETIGVPEEHPVSAVLSFDLRVRSETLTELLGVLNYIPGPLVVLGDFNLSDFEAAYRDVAKHFQNVYRTVAVGFGFTFPNEGRLPLPFLRIDHIWVRGSLVPVASGVDCRVTGSDHCLLWGDVAVR